MDALLNGPFGHVPLTSTPLTIGRLPDNHLVINDPKTSSRHAEIRQEGEGYTLTDVGSMNGTFVNEQQLVSNEPRLLHPGDVIRIGDTRFTYEAASAAPIEPTLYAGQVKDAASTPTIAVDPVSPTPVLSQEAQSQESQASPAAPQSLPSVSANTAYGVGMSSTSGIGESAESASSPPREENQQGYQRQPYVPYMPPNQSAPSSSSQPFPQQLMYGPSGQPMYGQPPMQPGYPQQPVYGQPMQPGYPQQPMYGQPGNQGYQMPQYGVVPGAAAQPRRKRTLPIIAAIVGAVVLLAIILGVVYFTTRSTPTKTLTTFCNDLKSSNYQDAYNQFSTRIRESVSESSFESTFRSGIQARGGLNDCILSNVSDDGSLGTGVMKLGFNDNGPLAVFNSKLVDENGTWKIDQLT